MLANYQANRYVDWWNIERELNEQKKSHANNFKQLWIRSYLLIISFYHLLWFYRKALIFCLWYQFIFEHSLHTSLDFLNFLNEFITFMGDMWVNKKFTQIKSVCLEKTNHFHCFCITQIPHILWIYLIYF